MTTAPFRIGVMQLTMEPLEEILDHARALDRHGFDTIWLAEAYPWWRKHSMEARSTTALSPLIARETERLTVGWGIISPYARHPIQVAMEARVTQEAAGPGRFRLGFGASKILMKEIGAGNGRPARPLTAVKESVQIVRAMLAGEEVTYAGRVFSVQKVKLEYKALRQDLPLLMAARGEQALTLCGKIADGLMISNMCPPDFTRQAVDIVRNAAREAGRQPPAQVVDQVVQYVPCAVRPDRAEAHRLAKETIGEMLPGFWSLGQRVPAAKSALLRAGELSQADFAAVVDRLRGGEPPTDVLDERFVDAFAIAGTAEDCLAQARRYRAAGTTELVLTFVGPQPEQDMGYLASARE